jgi:acetyl esterase/lipase
MHFLAVKINLHRKVGVERIMKNIILSITMAAVAALLAPSVQAQQTPPQAPPLPEPIALWPGTAPGEKGDVGEEKDTSPPNTTTPPGKSVMRLANVSKPTITVFRPAPQLTTGTAVIVCPGGGYSILAYDKEGTEVCQWLSSIGVTGILLKYRVPGRGGERYTAPLQDAQRAMGIVRSRAKEWNISPNQIGILGFSAGGHLSAALSTNYDTRTYPVVDAADQVSCRPDFTMLIYPAYINGKELGSTAPEIKVSRQTPPAFIVQTQDDGLVESSYVYGLALKRAEVPVELHIYPTGGHGYGLRPSPHAVSHWPQVAQEWLKSQGWLKIPSVSPR